MVTPCRRLVVALCAFSFDWLLVSVSVFVYWSPIWLCLVGSFMICVRGVESFSRVLVFIEYISPLSFDVDDPPKLSLLLNEGLDLQRGRS